MTISHVSMIGFPQRTQEPADGIDKSFAEFKSSIGDGQDIRPGLETGLERMDELRRRLLSGGVVIDRRSGIVDESDIVEVDWRR